MPRSAPTGDPAARPEGHGDPPFLAAAAQTLIIAVVLGLLMVSLAAAGTPAVEGVHGAQLEPPPADTGTTAARVVVRVPAVMRVLPPPPVEVLVGPGPGHGESARVVLECAGNVPHGVGVRALRGHHGVEWSADGRSWQPLSREIQPVVDGLPPGVRPGCAVVRFRIGDRVGDPGPRRVRVAFEVYGTR